MRARSRAVCGNPLGGRDGCGIDQKSSALIPRFLSCASSVCPGREVAERVEQEPVVALPLRLGVAAEEARDERAGGRDRRRVRVPERVLLVRGHVLTVALEPRAEGGERRRPRQQPRRMASGDALGAEVAADRRRGKGAARQQDAAVGDAEGLRQAEDRQVAERAERLPTGRGEPGLGGVLDEQQPPLAAPPEPGRGVLGEPQVVNEVERPRAGPEQRLQLARVRLEGLIQVVEPAGETGPHDRLDLEPAVVGGHQDLVARLEPERLHAVPDGVARLGEHLQARLLERERQDRRRPTQVDRGRQRWPRAQPAAAHRRPSRPPETITAAHSSVTPRFAGPGYRVRPVLSSGAPRRPRSRAGPPAGLLDRCRHERLDWPGGGPSCAISVRRRVVRSS